MNIRDLVQQPPPLPKLKSCCLFKDIAQRRTFSVRGGHIHGKAVAQIYFKTKRKHLLKAGHAGSLTKYVIYNLIFEKDLIYAAALKQFCDQQTH